MRASAFIVGLALVATAGIVPAAANATTGKIIVYSYERVFLGNDVQYLLLPASGKMKVPQGSKVSPALVKGAFNELRSRKPTTYGGSSIDLTPTTLAKGQATIKIDPSKSRYFLIIASETILTLEQFGIKSVAFPGHSKKSLTRKDLSFGLYTLQVPAWRALPPRSIQAARVVLHDGTVITSKTFYGRLKAKGDEAKALLTPYLASSDKNQLMAAMTAVTTAKPRAWPKLMVPLLKHKDPAIRTRALDALATQKSEDILAAIGATMDRDKDPAVALRAAKILGASKNKKFQVMALFHQLRGPDEAAAIGATAKIAASKQESGVPELEKAAAGKRDKLAIAAIEALGAMRRHAELQKIFASKKTKKPRRCAAAKQVASLSDAKARFAALAYIALNGRASEALKALGSLSKIKDPSPRPIIESALRHTDRSVRTAAATKLASLRDPASLKPLAAAAAAHPEDTETMQGAASTIMARLPLADIIQFTTNRNLGLKRIAYQALGAKANDATKGRIFDILVKGTKNKDAGIRRASTLALSVYGRNPKALKVLVGLAKDSDGKVRRNLARALSSWPAGVEYDLLMSDLTDKDGAVVAAAVDTLHKRGDDKAYKKILALYRGDPHPDKRVRMAALRGIVDLHPKKERQTVISVLSGGLYDKEREVKLLALELLGEFNNPAAVTGIALLINDPDETYRIASLRALGKTHSLDALELLVSVVGDPSKKVRMAALSAMGDLGQKAGIVHISTAIAMEKDPDIIAAGKAALKKIK